MKPRALVNTSIPGILTTLQVREGKRGEEEEEGGRTRRRKGGRKRRRKGGRRRRRKEQGILYTTLCCMGCY